MGRNYLTGRHGDRINAVLAAAGYNFSLLLRWFEELLRVLSLILCHALATPLHLTRCRKTFFTADYRCPGLGNSDIGADIAAGPSLTQPDAQPTATRSLVGAGCPNTDPVDVDLGHSSVSITRTRIWRKILEFIRLPLPLLPVARGRFFYRNIWPDFRVFRIQ